MPPQNPQDLAQAIYEAPISDVQATGVPLSTQQAIKGAERRAAYDVNQPYQDITSEENRPTPERLSRIERARFAPIDPGSKEAEDIVKLTDPRQRENLARDQALIDRLQGLTTETSSSRLKSFEDQLRLSPDVRADYFRSKSLKPVLGALKDEERQRLAGEINKIRSAPTFNHPGLRYSGQQATQIKSAQRSSEREMRNLEAKIRFETEQAAHKLGLSQHELDIGAFKSIGNLHSQETAQQLLAAQALNDVENSRLKKHHDYATLQHAFSKKKEARQQALLDEYLSEHNAKRDWASLKTARFAELLKGIPTSGGMSHNIRQSVSPIYSGANEMLGNTLYGVGQGLFPGRAQHASGDSVSHEALFNAALDNTDPLATYNRMIRHQLMLGLLARKQKQRRALAKGGQISPIQQGAAMAKETAASQRDNKYAEIMERQLAEAQRLRQPAEELPIASRIMQGINRGLAATPGYSALGKIGLDTFADKETEHQRHRLAREKSFQLEKDVAKELNDERKFSIQADLEERRTKAEERRAKADEMRASLGSHHKPHIIDGHHIVVDEKGQVHALPIEGFKQKPSKIDELKARSLSKVTEKELSNALEMDRKATETLPVIENLETLLPDIKSTIGPYAGYMPHAMAEWAAGKNGIMDKRQLFEAHSKQMLAEKMSVLKGAQSDYDAKNWEKTVTSLYKTPEANKKIIELDKAMTKRAQEYSQFLLKAIDEGHSLSDAKKEWKEFVDENPLLPQYAEEKEPSINSSSELDKINQELASIDTQLSSLG